MIRRMKIHYYGLRYYYLVFLLLFALFAGLSLTVLKTHYELLLPILFISFIFVTLALGLYEYNRIVYMHRSILVNRNPFFICSLVFGLINVIILLGLFIGYAFLLNYVHNIDISFAYNPYFYLIYMACFSFIYIIGNFYSLGFIRKLKINILISLIVFACYIYFEIRINKIITFVSKIIYLQIPNLHLIAIGLIPVIIIQLLINKLIFKKKN